MQKHKESNRWWSGLTEAGNVSAATIKGAPAGDNSIFVDSMCITNAYAGANTLTFADTTGGSPLTILTLTLPEGGQLDMHDDDYLFQVAPGKGLTLTGTQACNVFFAGFVARGV